LALPVPGVREAAGEGQGQQTMSELSNHTSQCPTCQKANKRANDFCDVGFALALEFARTHKPTSVEYVTLTDDQYQRLLDEMDRRRSQGSRN
jgi:Zn-dependent M32 family carboxypeptidase